MQSPTGGESPRIRQLADRSGEIPGPTVKVWMEEEFPAGFLFTEGLSSMVVIPALMNLSGFILSVNGSYEKDCDSQPAGFTEHYSSPVH